MGNAMHGRKGVAAGVFVEVGYDVVDGNVFGGVRRKWMTVFTIPSRRWRQW